MPQALQVKKMKSPSLFRSVSGFPHFGQNTNSWAYCLILSLIRDAGIFVPMLSSPDLLISPGAASSLRMYLRRWSGWRLSVFEISVKFDMIVLLPWRCPFTFGISNLSFSYTAAGRFSRPLLRSVS